MLCSLAKRSVAAVALCIFLSAGCRSEKSASAMAPDFSFKDLSGQPVSLSALRGHPVLMDFWATWCGPCRISIPAVDAFYRKHQAEGLHVVSINMDDDPSDVYAFVKRYKMSYPVVLG